MFNKRGVARLPHYAVAAMILAVAARAGPQLVLAQDDRVPALQDLRIRNAPASHSNYVVCSGAVVCSARPGCTRRSTGDVTPDSVMIHVVMKLLAKVLEPQTRSPRCVQHCTHRSWDGLQNEVLVFEWPDVATLSPTVMSQWSGIDLRVGHVRVHPGAAVPVGPRAGAARDGLVVPHALVAERQVVHAALRHDMRAARQRLAVARSWFWQLGRCQQHAATHHLMVMFWPTAGARRRPDAQQS